MDTIDCVLMTMHLGAVFRCKVKVGCIQFAGEDLGAAQCTRVQSLDDAILKVRIALLMALQPIIELCDENLHVCGLTH